MNNQIGIPVLPSKLRSETFPSTLRPLTKRIDGVLGTLKDFNCKLPPDYLEFPNFALPSLSEGVKIAIDKIAKGQVKDYLDRVCELMKGMPPKPPFNSISYQSGWTRYTQGEDLVKVDYPLENVMVLDTEVMVNMGNIPVLACAVTPKAWYIWMHPAYSSDKGNLSPELIPVGKNKLIIGHNVAFDRSYLEDEYNLKPTGNRFIDTLSMHQCVATYTNQQLKMALKVKGREKSRGEDELDTGFLDESNYTPSWLDAGSMANLVDVYNFHVKPLVPLTPESKAIRGVFLSRSLEVIHQRREALTSYCLNDVSRTWEILKVLFPKYRRANPSDVTFMGGLVMGSGFLPLAPDFHHWSHETERVYQRKTKELSEALTRVALETLEDFKSGDRTKTLEDPWLCNLDWDYSARGKFKGLPKWYKSLLDKDLNLEISPTKRCVPYLLKLRWDNSPVRFFKDYGWCYECLSGEITSEDGKSYKRIPHKDGGEANCGNPLGKNYGYAIESGLMDSDNPLAKELLYGCIEVSYWRSTRSRVLGDESKNEPGLLTSLTLNPYGKHIPVTLPRTIVHQTSSRRAAESLWLTVSSPKKNKIGSELKSRVQAPEGWSFIGADFDTQEMRIGGILGDALNGLHGSFPMSYTNLTGTKEAKTDCHYQTSNLLGIDRQLAKIINYQLMYFCGKSGLSRTIRSFNPAISEGEANAIADRAITTKRGNKNRSNGMFYGGTDSLYYNYVHNVTESVHPRTPALKAAIPDTLTKSNVGNEFTPSRNNWVIQSSGVDLLHLTLTGIEYLLNLFKVEYKFIFTLHDEIWYMCREGQEKLTAYCFNLAHFWAWSYFNHEVGLYDLPVLFSFFSGVNVDKCLRKEVDECTVTPSNHDNVPSGYVFKPTDFEGFNPFEGLEVDL